MTTRKSFIGGMLAAGAVPAVVPHSVFGKNAPSNRVTVGGIGIGGIGNAQLPQMKRAGFEVVALCDLDWQYAERVFKKFPQARKYKDYEEMLRLEGDKLDAVYCGCPDHWHTLVCLAAIAKKKHLCCVKPLTRFVDECRVVVKAAREAGVATQMTANSNCDEASMRLYEYLNAGIIGDVVEAHAWSRRPVWPQGMVSYADWEDPIPEGFNWKKWIGPAKYVPFASKWGKHAPYEKMSKEAWCGDAVYHPFNFRGWFEYGAGALGDMGCHRANTLYKALDLKWPTHVEASCSRVSEVAFPLASMVTFDYPARGTKPECRVIWRAPPAEAEGDGRHAAAAGGRSLRRHEGNDPLQFAEAGRGDRDDPRARARRAVREPAANAPAPQPRHVPRNLRRVAGGLQGRRAGELQLRLRAVHHRVHAPRQPGDPHREADRLRSGRDEGHERQRGGGRALAREV